MSKTSILKSQIELYTSLPSEPSAAIEQILWTKTACVFCDIAHRSGLTNLLMQKAAEEKREVCILDAAIPQDMTRLMVSSSLDISTGKLQLTLGQLKKCLIEGGLLIIWNPDASKSATLEQLNGILEGQPLPNFNEDKMEALSSNLKIIAFLEKNSNSLNLSSITPTFRDRFEQIRIVPEDFTLAPFPVFTPNSEFNEKLLTVELDCRNRSADKLRNWLHKRMMDENGRFNLRISKLAQQMTSNSGVLQIRLKNLNITDQEVEQFFREWHFNPIPFKIDGITYDFTRVKFFIDPPLTLQELKKQTQSKKLQKVTPEQIGELRKKGDVFYLNESTISKLGKLVYSKKNTDEDKYSWRIKKGGYFEFFDQQQKNIHFLVIDILSPESWHYLIHHKKIESISVVNSVFIPEPWKNLFVDTNLDNSFPVYSKSTRNTPWVKLWLVKQEEQWMASISVKDEETIILNTANDTNHNLIIDYDSKLQSKNGQLLELVKKGNRVVITGETLLRKFPNLFNESSLAEFNGNIIELFKTQGEIILLLDPLFLNQYPWLTHLPRLEIEYKPIPPSKKKYEGYHGIKQAFIDGHPLVLAEGPKASGKSFSLTRMVKEGFAHVFKYTLTPSTSFNQLKKLIHDWAQPNASDNYRYRILAFDEINLAKPEVLLWLQSIITTPGHMILPDGEVIRLNDKHCLLGLMNATQQTVGRHEHSVLKSMAPTVKFSPLTSEQIRNEVIVPNLKNYFNDNKVEEIADLLMNLTQQIEKLQPGLQLDPRDLLAIIARMASWDYIPEVKISEKPALSINYRASLRKAILEVVSPQLSYSKLEPFNHWINVLFADINNDSSPFTKIWVDDLLSENKELWNIESSRQLMYSVADYLQTHAFYENIHKRIIPGKSALLIIGDTNAGKSFLTKYMTQKFGYRYGENFFEWTAGSQGDLLAFIEKAKKNGWMVIIHEINLLPTEVIEGALNAALTGDSDAHPGFGLIMTANDFNERQKLSEPFLSRVKIKKVNNPSPEELLNLYKVPQEIQETLLEAYQLAGSHASIRGLINAIKHYQAGMHIHLACAMVFGLLQAENPGSEGILTTTESKEKNLDFLKLIGSDRLMVSVETSDQVYGNIDIMAGKIKLPALPISPNAEDYQKRRQLILLHSLHFQIATAMGIKQDTVTNLLQSLQALAAMLHLYPKTDQILIMFLADLHPLNFIAYYQIEIGNFDHLYKEQNDIFTELTQNYRNLGHNIATSMVLLCIRWATVYQLAKQPIHWRRIKFFCEKAPDCFPYLKMLGKIAAWMEKESVLSTQLTSWISPLTSPFKLSSAAKEGASATSPLVEKISKLLKIQDTESKQSKVPSKLFSLFSKKTMLPPPKKKYIPSGGSFLTSNSAEIATCSSDESFNIPLECYTLHDGIPVLKNGLMEKEIMPRHFFPAQKPKSPLESKTFILKAPLKHDGNAIELLVPLGFYPITHEKNVKIEWQAGKFYAFIDGEDEKPFAKPFRYQVIKGDLNSDSKFETSKVQNSKSLINDFELPTEIQEYLNEIPEDTTNINEIVFFAQNLALKLANSFFYLDRNNPQSRYELEEAYHKNLAAVVSWCIKKSEAVCVESGIILLNLLSKILTEFSVSLYLVSGICCENGIITEEGHAFVVMKFRDGQQIILDSSPSRQRSEYKEIKSSELSSSSSFQTLPENPLLQFCYPQFSKELEKLMYPFYRFSFDNSTTYGPGPEGELIHERQLSGITDFFKTSLLAQKRQPQTIIITSIPQELLYTSASLYETHNCMHFLFQKFFERNFKFFIFIENENQFVQAINADHLLDLLSSLKTPKIEQLEEFKKAYPFPILTVDSDLLKKTLQDFSKILMGVVTNKTYQDYFESKKNIFSQSVKSGEINEIEHTLTIENKILNQNDINQIIVNREEKSSVYFTSIHFEKCNFTEKLNLSQLKVREITFSLCENICPNFATILADTVRFRKQCSFNDWSEKNIDILINDSKSEVIHFEDTLAPKCITVKASSKIQVINIIESADKIPLEKLVLERNSDVIHRQINLLILYSSVFQPYAHLNEEKIIKKFELNFHSTIIQQVVLILDTEDPQICKAVNYLKMFPNTLFPYLNRELIILNVKESIQHFILNPLGETSNPSLS